MNDVSILLCAYNAEAMVIARSEIEAVLRNVNSDNYSDLSISVEPGVSTNGQRFCHFTLYAPDQRILFEKSYTYI